MILFDWCTDQFVLKFEKDDVTISVLSYVKLEDEVYKLYIKGNYPRGSTAVISIGNKYSTLDKMYIIILKCMEEIIPVMATKDYPESLEKIAKDKKSNE